MHISTSTLKRLILHRWYLVVGAIFALSAFALWVRFDSSQEPKELTEKIGKHIILPDDESPAQLTVLDKTKVKSPFLKNAENGDKVLIYQNHQKAVIYRPSVDKIVDVTVIQIDDVSSLKAR